MDSAGDASARLSLSRGWGLEGQQFLLSGDDKARPNGFEKGLAGIWIQGIGIEVPRSSFETDERTPGDAWENARNVDIAERFELAVPRPRGKPRGTHRARRGSEFAAKTKGFLYHDSWPRCALK